MGKIGKISVIPKDTTGAFPSQEKSLRENGFSRFPGTGRFIFPYKETDGLYRTGLDENAKYIDNIPDTSLRDAERKRVKELRMQLEKDLGVDLGPRSQFFNFASNVNPKVEGYKLSDRDNIFNLDDPYSAVTFAWVRVHPAVSPSLEAYYAGRVPADTQFFVNDESVENHIAYTKKKTINDAVGKLNALSLERRKKVGRLMDLPINDDTIEEVVYNMLDTIIHSPEMPSGQHKGRNPIDIFNMYVNLEDNTLDVRDLVEQAFKHQIYREKKGGKVYEGEYLAWETKDEMIEHLLDDKNQNDRLTLEKKLKTKKFAQV